MQKKTIIENQSEKLDKIFATIESIQLQLNELKQSLRAEQQLIQAQNTEDTINSIKENYTELSQSNRKANKNAEIPLIVSSDDFIRFEVIREKRRTS